MTGKIFLQWLGTRPQLVVMESDLIKEVLNNKNRAYPKLELQGYLKKLFGDGIVTTEGEKWVKLRKLANHAFHVENLKVRFFFLGYYFLILFILARVLTNRIMGDFTCRV